LPESAGQSLPLPWKVKFHEEPAVDAGGPGRELMNEFAASIFHPTTQLMIPAPTSTEYFVPFSPKADDFVLNMFKSIGKFLGIVARTGLCQALPFAPFVWKFIVGERISETDIVSCDANLGDVFAAVRGGFACEWAVLSWTGERCVLLNHSREAVVGAAEVESFIEKCVSFRVDSLFIFLDNMKKGFFANLGRPKSPFLSAHFLSRICQGEVVISVPDLMQCTRYSGYAMEDLPVRILWAVVEKLTNEQRSLFLRFVTTLTRFPSRSRGSFSIEVQKVLAQHPNQDFIRASTCFNRLYLPQYSDFNAAYRRITTAITWSPTLENV
jgi:hypothetical protein